MKDISKLKCTLIMQIEHLEPYSVVFKLLNTNLTEGLFNQVSGIYTKESKLYSNKDFYKDIQVCLICSSWK